MSGEKPTYLPKELIGEKFDSRDLALEKFAEKGVRVGRTTIGNLRIGLTSGRDILEDAMVHERLTLNDASLKTELYSDIAESGLRNRRERPNRKNLYTGFGLMGSISEDMGIPEQYIRKVFRAMRVDLATFDKNDSSLRELFLNVYSEFSSKSLSLPPSLRPPAPILLDREWDRESIIDFYTILYSSKASAHIGPWTAYESEIFREFYKMQTKSGDKLTEFDHIVLQSHEMQTKEVELVQEIRGTTGIPIDHDVLTIHRNAIIQGSPIFNKP